MESEIVNLLLDPYIQGPTDILPLQFHSRGKAKCTFAPTNPAQGELVILTSLVHVIVTKVIRKEPYKYQWNGLPNSAQESKEWVCQPTFKYRVNQHNLVQ